MLDTEQTHTEGVGTVNLKDEQFELLLTPQPKHPGIFTLHSSIRIDGSFERIHFSIAKRAALERGARAATPITRSSPLTPLIGTSRFKDSQCARILGATAAADHPIVAKE